MDVTVQQGGTRECGWELVSAPVPAALRPWVTRWLGYREWSAAPVSRWEYPTGEAVMIVDLGEPLSVLDRQGQWQRHVGGFLAGVDDGPSLTSFAGGQQGIQVTLTPWGARALANTPARPLARQVVSLADVGVPASLADRLASVRGWPRRFTLLAADLRRRLVSSSRAWAPEPSGLVSWALGRMEASHGAVRVEALAQRWGVSRKHLHERFVEEVGLSPKRHAEVIRFRHLRTQLAGCPPGGLAALAARLGYADQSHLVREVRRFSGTHPTALRAVLQDPMSLAALANASSSWMPGEAVSAPPASGA